MAKKIIFILIIFNLLFVTQASALLVGPPPPCPLFCGPPPPPPPPAPPEPEEPDPVIILHGIAASINPDLFFSEILNDSWSFIPGVKTYDDLIKAFVNQGFSTSTDLFIGFYDWRQSNAESATEYLMPVIDEALAKSGKDKVDIVAHSMGGLVARSYIQSDSYRGDVDQLIMLGTPNKGASDTYLIWEGAQLPEGWSPLFKQMMNIYINLVLFAGAPKIGEPPLTNAVQVVQSKIPSLKELLPVYNFLIDKDTGNPLGYKFLSTVNDFLEDLNDDINTLTSRVKVTVISGDNISTINQITVKPQSPIDALFNKWPDGKPDPNPPIKDSTQGDNRVLLASSQITGIVEHIVLDSSRHDRLPTLAQQDVIEVLTGERPVAFFDTPEPESVLGFMAASPVEIKVTDPLGNEFSKTLSEIPDAEYLAETNPEGVKLIFIPDPVNGDYLVELTGIGAGGEYHLITGFADNSTTTDEVLAGNIDPGRTVLYQAEFNPASPKLLQTEVITLETLQNNLEKYWQEGLITKFSTYLKLKAKLIGLANIFKTIHELAEKAANAPWYLKQAFAQGRNGLNNAASQQFDQFIKEVKDEKGKTINKQAADLLIEQAEYLRDSL